MKQVQILGRLSTKARLPWRLFSNFSTSTTGSTESPLPSVNESIAAHVTDINNGKSTRNFVTTDPETLDLYRSFCERNPWLEELQYLNPSNTHDSTGEHTVLIKDASECPYEYSSTDAVSFLAVGGPAAQSAVFMHAALNPSEPNLYCVNNYTQSNANWSAMQLHSRHGTALNADRTLTGHALLPIFFRRMMTNQVLRLLFPTLVADNIVTESQKPDYVKVDLNIRSLTLSNALLYIQNEFLWLLNAVKRLLNIVNEHDINRFKSTDSQEIYKLLEKQTGLSLTSFSQTQKSTAIHFALSSEEVSAMVSENWDLKKYSNIDSINISKKDLEEFLGERASHVHGAWKYPGDGYSLFNAHNTMRDYLNKKRPNSKWVEDATLKTVYVDTKTGEPHMIGAELDINGKNAFIPTKRAFLTLGYRAKFQYTFPQSSFFKTPQSPIPNIGIATGCSIVAIFKKTDAIDKITDKYGIFPQFSTKNSHWSLITSTGSHLLVRITGGGNMGEETYQPTYFLNLIANTQRLFGSALIGIVSTNACPRVLNAPNSGKFVRLASGLIVSYGKGGTGITQRKIEALAALRFLEANHTVECVTSQLPNIMDLYNINDMIEDKADVTKQIGLKQR